MFKPKFRITPKIAQLLMRIESAKEVVAHLPMTPKIQSSLRETARLLSTHYSTQIEGNRLTLEEAARVIQKSEHFPSRKRDEKEVLGYYRALDALEKLSRTRSASFTESTVKLLHALVMGGKRGKVKPTAYRNGQNVIRDSRDGAIVYLPPEAKDVSNLMDDLIVWIRKSQKQNLPCPLIAAIAHYQFATIHPYYDGNGRTARLLATLILHLGGYDLKGFYSLEEYYAQNLKAYYQKIAIGPSHNYYLGRAEADITSWVEYFCIGMAESFDSVKKRVEEAARAGEPDQSSLLRELDARQRKALSLFQKSDWITANQIAILFGIQSRAARNLCQKWIESNFLAVADPSKKNRKYLLNDRLRHAFQNTAQEVLTEHAGLLRRLAK